MVRVVGGQKEREDFDFDFDLEGSVGDLLFLTFDSRTETETKASKDTKNEDCCQLCW